mmetsp:Transcript_2185/g.3041  ORF Transcript_2185/g.3041 Transcript_2185/m.3041 type:complete len:418 (+) Transcript_2185:130-1383(+)
MGLVNCKNCDATEDQERGKITHSVVKEALVDVVTPYGPGQMKVSYPGDSSMREVALDFGIAYLLENKLKTCKVATPYGVGELKDYDGTMCCVKLPFGEAYLSAHLAEPIFEPSSPRSSGASTIHSRRASEWLREKQEIIAQARAEVAGLRSELNEVKKELALRSDSNLFQSSQGYERKASGKTALESKEYHSKRQDDDLEAALHLIADVYQWSVVTFDPAQRFPQFSGIRSWTISLVSVKSKKLSFSSSKNPKAVSLSPNNIAQIGSSPSRAGEPFVVFTVVDNTGHILGRSARSKPGDLSYPVHVMCGSTPANSEEEERFLFVQLKHFKAKSGSLRASEIGFAFASFGSLAGALHHDLPIYKKPVDFTMDPKKLSKSGGRMVIRVDAPKAEAKGQHDSMMRRTSANSPICNNGFDI